MPGFCCTLNFQQNSTISNIIAIIGIVIPKKPMKTDDFIRQINDGSENKVSQVENLASSGDISEALQEARSLAFHCLNNGLGIESRRFKELDGRLAEKEFDWLFPAKLDERAIRLREFNDRRAVNNQTFQKVVRSRILDFCLLLKGYLKD
jgi:hypothetical protein